MTVDTYFKYNKIVIFDENSALDILDQENNGRLQYLEHISTKKSITTMLKGLTSTPQNVGLNTDLFLNFIAKFNLEKQIDKQISNTIKSDFIKEIESKITDYKLEYIENYKLNILANTTTFMKTLSPIIHIIKDFDKLEGTEDLKNINFENFEQTLDDMKSYHEFVARKGNSIKIIRINPAHLQNNYKLTDLRNMNMNIVGIKIGQASINDISFEQMVNTDDNDLFQQDISENLSIEKAIDSLSNSSFELNSKITEDKASAIDENDYFQNLDRNKKFDMIDVIIAGIK